MLASLLIIGCSLVLFVYWFRYSCMLLLRNSTGPARTDSRFSFTDIQRLLQSGHELDPLHASLNRDYQVLIYLLQHAAGLGTHSIEDRLLLLDYKVMQWRYRLPKTAAPDQ